MSLEDFKVGDKVALSHEYPSCMTGIIVSLCKVVNSCVSIRCDDPVFYESYGHYHAEISELHLMKE